MRIIKFRGKRLDNGEWVEGFYIKNPDIPAGQNEHEILISDGYECTPVIPSSVGQFTGLRDKNDKEIYEGDIVFCKWSLEEKNFFGEDVAKDFHAIIQYESSGFVLKTNCINLDNMVGKDNYLIEGFETKIISNIHDNPELLKTDRT